MTAQRLTQKTMESTNAQSHDGNQEEDNLYSGRWTADEEKYAQYLIQEFKAGNISDLENGSTLRNCLAQMLICPPKRITKSKYSISLSTLFIIRQR